MYVCSIVFSNIAIMKKSILLFVLIGWFCCFRAEAQQNIILTGCDNFGGYVQLHHAIIEDLTQGWIDTIFYPDTIFILPEAGGEEEEEGVEDYYRAKGLFLSQNTPNPFDGTTDFIITIPYEDNTVVEVFDMAGRRVTHKSLRLQPGAHAFRVWLSPPQQYVLKVWTSHEEAAIKMVNNGMGGDCRIAYDGAIAWNNALKSVRSGGYEEGDLLHIVGFRRSGDVFQTSDTVEINTLPNGPVSLTFDNCAWVSSADSPYVVTGDVASITRTSAVCSGEIVWEGFSPVVERGICWDTLPAPTLIEGYIPSGEGAGVFSVTLSDLTPETDYYYRAYATTPCGTVYGESVHFTSGAYQAPTVVTDSVTAITDTSALLGGFVVDDGGMPILERGFCWGAPTLLADSCFVTPSVIDTFSSSLTGLAFATQYYVIAYATNERGTSYGALLEFTTAAVLPEVALDTITDIGSSYATCRGTLLSDGGDTATVVGLCWAASIHPTITDSHVEWDGAAGTFSRIIGGIHDSVCYVRPYATNSVGTVYGNTLSFEPDTMPTSVHVSLVHLDHDYATIRVTIVCDSTAAIDSRGLCMDTLPQPDLSDLEFPAVNAVNTFDTHIGDLERASTYYLRGHCISNGTLMYSDDYVLLTVAEDGQPCVGTPTLTDWDGHVYNTVQVGAQCWMRSNLYTSHFPDGSAIPNGQPGASLSSKYDPYYYRLTYDANLTPLYGYGYNWKALTKRSSTTEIDPQGVCPDGWHIPDDAEWMTLKSYTGTHYACGGDSTYVGKALADISQWNSSTVNCSPGAYPSNNNLTGFSAIAAGGYISNPFHANQIAYLWSRSCHYTFNSTPYYSYAHVFKISYNSPTLDYDTYYYDRAFPVRCVRNDL